MPTRVSGRRHDRFLEAAEAACFTSSRGPTLWRPSYDVRATVDEWSGYAREPMARVASAVMGARVSQRLGRVAQRPA